MNWVNCVNFNCRVSSCVCAESLSHSDSLQTHGLYPPGSSVYGITLVRIPERIAISYSRGSSWTRNCTHICITSGFFTIEPPGKLLNLTSVHFSSVTQSCLTLCDPMNCITPGLPVHHQLPEFTQTHVHRVSDASQPSHPLSSPSPPVPNPSQHQGLFQWVKYWSFSFSIIPSNEHPGLISFRMDQLDLLAIQGTRKSLLQHHSSKASILQRSAFFTLQLSHPYLTTGKTVALTRRTLLKK